MQLQKMLLRTRFSPFVLIVAVVFVTSVAYTQSASAQEDSSQDDSAQDDSAQDDSASTELEHGAWVDYPRALAFEVNVLWPVFPGGMVDLKLIIPALMPDTGQFRGEAIIGLHSDFGWRVVRPIEDYGKVAFIGLKIGWRQFLGYGLHIDASVNIGWRHEEQNPRDGEVIHALQARFWVFAGWQYEFSRRVYVNVRGGVGIHIFRTDRFASDEKLLVPAGDLNLGFRFD